MRKMIFFAIMLFLIAFMAPVMFAQEPTLDILQTEVNTTKIKTDDNNSRIQGLEGNLLTETNDRHVADQNLENQINNIQLTPGPKGDKGDKGNQGETGQMGLQGPAGAPSWNESKIQELEAKILELEKKVGPFCGNGKLENGEQCDDGNNVDGDHCSSTCQYEFLPPGINSNSIDLNSNLAQYLHISDLQQVGLDITGDITQECWIKLKDQSLLDKGYPIMSKYNYVNNQRSWLWNYANHQEITGFMFVASSDGNGGGGFAIIPKILNNNIWYHAAMIYDHVIGSVEFFINGSSIDSASGTLPRSMLNSNSNFAIGTASIPTGANGYFDGLIDDCRVWNYKRTPTEIASYMNTELFGNEPGLMGYWKFNGNFLDSSPNGNHLTGVNSPTFSSDAPF